MGQEENGKMLHHPYHHSYFNYIKKKTTGNISIIATIKLVYVNNI